MNVAKKYSGGAKHASKLEDNMHPGTKSIVVIPTSNIAIEAGFK
jgi:hypothetical protein